MKSAAENSPDNYFKTRKHCQFIAGKSPGLSDCILAFPFRKEQWLRKGMQLNQNYSCASAHDFHMVPLMLPAKEKGPEVTCNGLMVIGKEQL
jgi:hypothetical protein